MNLFESLLLLLVDPHRSLALTLKHLTLFIIFSIGTLNNIVFILLRQIIDKNFQHILVLLYISIYVISAVYTLLFVSTKTAFGKRVEILHKNYPPQVFSGLIWKIVKFLLMPVSVCTFALTLSQFDADL